ncbi:MAG: BolA family protein [Pseudomonadota bacterium]
MPESRPLETEPLEPEAFARQIYRILDQEIKPERLEIINESHLHSGHQSSPGTGHSHFRIRMHAPDMACLSRLERQRIVNQALANELAGPIHALAIEITV